MKSRKLLPLFLILFTSVCFNQLNAQVGIGTDSPENTLHVRPLDPNEDPLKVENLNQIVQGDSTFLVVDPSTGVIRYMPILELGNYISIDQSNTNELQNANEVPLSPIFDVDGNGLPENNVQEAIEAFSLKLPKGTYKSVGDARLAGLNNGDAFYTDPEGVFGCSGCIITLYEGMN